MANEINSFLQKSLESVNSKDVKKYHFVMGNEASDMDSIISSISYAFFRQSQVKNEKEEAYVPVMNIPRKDFALRTETDYIFQKLGINKQNLLFYPEIQSLLDNSKGNVHFILVDHNRLASYQEKYGMLVEEIIDHHKDEKLYTNLNRTIEMVGSCATLVAEKLFENKSPLISNHAMCTLLLGVILLDTVNLDPKYKKVTPKDIDYAKKLSKALQFDDNKQKTLFEELQGKRFDVSSLSTYDLLRADYKQWKMNQVVVGISSCKRSFAEWFEKDPDITRDAERICTNFKLDILFIMTQFMDSKNEMRRELGIFTKKKDLHDNVVTFLMTTDLKLEAIETQKSQTLSQNEKIITFYTQKNVGLSRKQLQPFLDSFYSKK